MAFSRSPFSRTPWLGVLSSLLTLSSLIQSTLAQKVQVVQNSDGVYVSDDRKPSLYTQNFGDCLGNSEINVTRFDAAYYKDNMTVLFHLEGNTAMTNESLMSMNLLSFDDLGTSTEDS